MMGKAVQKTGRRELSLLFIIERTFKGGEHRWQKKNKTRNKKSRKS